jgi:hypothetical protein
MQGVGELAAEVLGGSMWSGKWGGRVRADRRLCRVLGARKQSGKQEPVVMEIILL